MKAHHSRGSKTFLLFIVFIFCSPVIRAQKTWDGGGDGSTWSSANNWNPNGVPGATDIVLFNTNTVLTILDVPTQNIGRLQVTGTTNVTLKAPTSGNRTLTVTAAANNAVLIDAGATLTIAGRDNGSNDRRLTLTTANTAGLEARISGTLRVALDIAGQPNTYGTFTKGGSNATIRMYSTANYIHDVNGSTIPTAVWDDASTCTISGITNTVPGGLTQSFGNFSWNCPGQTADIDFDGNLTAVDGSLSVGNTNLYKVVLVSANNSNYSLDIGGDLEVNDNTWFSITNGDNIIAAVNVDGNFVMTGASYNSTFFDFHIGTGGSMTLNKVIMNVNGNFSQSGGMFDFAYGSSNAASYNEMVLRGDFSLTGTGLVTTSTTDNSISNGLIVFNKAGIQTFTVTTPSNIRYTNFTIVNNSRVSLQSDLQLSSSATSVWGGQLTINNGAVLDAGTNQVVSSSGIVAGLNNAFILNPGAGLISANVNGIQNVLGGTVSLFIASRTFSSAANYTFNGSSTQSSGLFTTTPNANQVNDLTINNTAGNTTTGVTLSQPLAIAGTLSLQSGHVTTTSNLLTMNAGSTVAGSNFASRISGGTDNSFINGPMRKIGNTAFLFPVGKLNAGHRYNGISAPATISSAFTSEFRRASALGLGAINIAGLFNVSNCEYWDLQRTSGSSSANVILSWSGNSNCNAAVYVSDLSALVVARLGTGWDSFNNNGGSTGNASSGSVSWTNVSSFGSFALGSNAAGTNPLPVKFSSVKAYSAGRDNQVEWTNETELAVENYEVERSVNGINFSVITTQFPQVNTGSRASYSIVDRDVNRQTYFYRIRSVEKPGLVTYSAIVKVHRGVNGAVSFNVYPNPVKNGLLIVQLGSEVPANYTIGLRSQSGQQVYSTVWHHAGGSTSRTIELPAAITPGFYFLSVTGNGESYNSKLVVQ